jgi:hypothetical protein
MVVGDSGLFLKTVNYFDLKLNGFVHINIMHLPSKFHGKQMHGLKDMMKITFRLHFQNFYNKIPCFVYWCYRSTVLDYNEKVCVGDVGGI